MRSFTYILIFLFTGATLLAKKPKEGVYRGAIVLNEEKQLEAPFNFEVKYHGKKPVITIHNADEKIVVDEITIKGDSVNFKMPVFDTEFRTVVTADGLEGVWINHYRQSNNVLKFKATFGERQRFLMSPSDKFLFQPGETLASFEGRWEVTFSPGLKDSSKAIGVFHHQEQTDFVTGTFLTETGDYRYLEGLRLRNTLMLSAFDGSHAYLFVAELKDGEVKGTFYSGAHFSEPWIARRNDAFKLADAEEISIVRDKDQKLEFTFPDTDKKQISLSDKKFGNKPVIIQVMGSWCPNCMDESVYFSQLYRQYKNDGLEIIALAFEKTTDFEKARSQVQRMKTRLKLDYDVLITQQTGKEKAGEVLSALNKINAFPTTLFLDRQHRVVKVHTGFSGPATGQEYEIYKQRTENLVRQLLKP